MVRACLTLEKSFFYLWYLQGKHLVHFLFLPNFFLTLYHNVVYKSSYYRSKQYQLGSVLSRDTRSVRNTNRLLVLGILDETLNEIHWKKHVGRTSLQELLYKNLAERQYRSDLVDKNDFLFSDLTLIWLRWWIALIFELHLKGSCQRVRSTRPLAQFSESEF